MTFDFAIRLRRDFSTTHLIAKFHYTTFNCSEVIVRTNKHKLTNKQTPLKTFTSLRYATPVEESTHLIYILTSSAIIQTIMSTGCCRDGRHVMGPSRQLEDNTPIPWSIERVGSVRVFSNTVYNCNSLTVELSLRHDWPGRAELS